MALDPSESFGGGPRRIVLVDFDWQDADLLPQLLRMPGISVALVAGRCAEDAGVRVAGLCGLPSTLELADLTREIFDLALVGEGTPRREQIERFLRAVGTPIESPLTFVRNGEAAFERRSATRDVAPPTLAPEPADEFPAPGDESESGAFPDARDLSPAHPDHGAVPGPDETLALEKLLARWLGETSAASVELHFADGDSTRRACRAGADDLLLGALVQLVRTTDGAHVLSRLDGPQLGRLWGAWPIRTPRHRAVLAVAAADPGTADTWERHTLGLRDAWVASESTPVEGTGARLTLLPVDAFLRRLEMTVDRNRSEGARFSLHRIRFEGAAADLDALLVTLPGQMRGTDALCRHGTHEVLLLCSGPPHAFVHLRRRIVALWHQAWRDGGHPETAPPIADEHVVLADPDDSRTFLDAALGWLARA